MAEHFSKVREVEEAIIRGDVEAAQSPARWIADHPELGGFPARTDEPIARMKAAADSVAKADNITDAAIGAATLVGACGSCHAAAKVSPTLPAATEGRASTARGRHMLEHQHAADLMYRGLIAPLSGDWLKGAETLKAAPLGGKALADVSKEAVAAETRVHELADRAIRAAEQSTRVEIYGSVIGECASCHGLHGSIWGPGPPKAQ
jgi:cytochrome c553